MKERRERNFRILEFRENKFDIIGDVHGCYDELMELMKQGYDVVQLSSIMETNVNLMLIKLNELNRMGWQLNLPYVPRSDFLKNVKPEG